MTLWRSLVAVNVSGSELSCVRVTLVLDWHPVVALRLELQNTLSHRIDAPLSVIWVAVTNWLCLTCLVHLIVREHVTWLLTEHLSYSGERRRMYFTTSRVDAFCRALGNVTDIQFKFSLCSATKPDVRIQSVRSISCQRCVWFGLQCGLYVGMCVCLCSLDSPPAQSVFIEQPPQIPTIAKLPAQTHRQYASQSCSCVTV